MNTIKPVSVGHVGITVSEMERSLRFYRDALGFQVSKPAQVSGPLFEKLTGVPGCVVDVAFARGLGYTIELLCYQAPADRRTSTLRSCDPGFWHLCLKVKDIDRVVRTLREHGFEPLSDIQNIMEPPTAGLRVVYARDPDGVVLEIMEEPPGFSLEDAYLSMQ